jgi:hypothetical protein
MKMMKTVLLATAALAVVSASARADDAAAIKAQLEALNARIAQLEAGPAMPVGYSLLTVTEGQAMTVPGLEDTDSAYGDKATIISILPTADAPASTTIEWSGYVRAAAVYNDYDDNQDVVDPFTVQDSTDTDVLTRGQLKVVGKTDTAVGEVGARVQLRVNADGYGDKNFISNEHWGWWAMTPELTLGGGYTGSLGNVGYGYDGACSCYYTDNADVAFNPGDVTQMRLSWASGPLSFAIALEDATGSTTTALDNALVVAVPGAVGTDFGGDGDALGVAGELKYSGDMFNGEISAVWHEGPALAAFDQADRVLAAVGGDSWQVGAGLGFELGDMASLSLAAAIGRENDRSDYWGVSGLVSADLSDSVHGEIAAGYKKYKFKDVWSVTPAGLPLQNFSCCATGPEVLSVLAGLYYEPVEQLTIGIEAEHTKTDQGAIGIGLANYKETQTTIDLVTVFRF